MCVVGFTQSRYNSLLIHDCCVQEEQKCRGGQPQVRLREVTDGDSPVGKTKRQAREAKENIQIPHAEEEEEEQLLIAASKAVHQTCGEHIDERATILCLLKACAQQKDVQGGSSIHVDAIRRGLLERDVFVGSALVNMYAKCGALPKAQEVFSGLPLQNIVSWNALISGYAQHGHGEEVLICFEQMVHEGLAPNAVTFTCILKACGSIGDIDKGQKVHAQTLREGLVERDVVIGTGLVDMYAKCGSLSKAQDVFDGLLVRNMISWNVLIGGYAQHGHGEEALTCFERMQLEGFSPNIATIVYVLKACGSIGTSDEGQEIHMTMLKEGLLGRNTVITHALVDMYAKCGSLSKAQEVFDELPVCDLASWTALIAGYTQHGYGEEALNCFERMQAVGLSPDAVTYSCVLKACGSIGAAKKGLEIHAQILSNELLKKNIVVGTALVDMYAKCGMLGEAQGVFNKLPIRDVVSWNALIGGYAQHGHGEEALACFRRMQLEHLSPDAVTFACSLKACGSIGAALEGQEIHKEIVRGGPLETNIVVANALIDMYAKCELLTESQEVFDRLPFRDAISWSALLAGYVQHGHFEEALSCFEEMQYEGHSPDACTYVGVIKACGSMGAVDKGQELHVQILGDDLVENDMVVGTALIDMYAKFGMLEEAQSVFEELSGCDVVSWNALISGYAHLGKFKVVFNTFEQMIGEGIGPDLVTFIVVLTTCSHGGLLEEGHVYFENMSTEYGLIQTLDHKICMVDLFARAGNLNEAVTVIKEMHCSANLTVWHTLLGACIKWEHLKLGCLAFEQATQLYEKDSAAFVCLSNIHAAGVRHEFYN